MLTKFALTNFKSIGDPGLELDLKPLTILVGPNGSGKSSTLEGIALLLQTTRVRQRQYSYKASSGSLVGFPSFKEFVYKHALKNWVTIEIHAELEEAERGTLKPLAAGINQAPWEIAINMDGINTLGYRLSQRHIVQDGIEWEENKEGFLIDGNLVAVLEREYERTGRVSSESFISPRRKTIGRPALLHDFADTAISLIRGKSKAFFVSALRGAVSYQVSTAEISEWVGKHGENLLSILAQISAPGREDERGKIRKWAAEFDIKDPWVGWTGANRASGSFIDPKLNIASNLALAGHGSRQILSVIAQLFCSEAGDLIMLEEPETSIHPSLQSKLATLFAEVVQERKQLIITTHSMFLPLLALKELGPQKVGVYGIVKGENGTQAQPLQITEKGYIKDWVPQFADEALMLVIQDYFRSSANTP